MLTCRRRVVIIVGVSVALFLVWRLTLHLLVAAELAAIRAQGYPVTMAELEAWYPAVPDEENAARIYEHAFARFAGQTNNKWDSLPVVGLGKLPRGTTPLPKDTARLLADYLVEYREAMSLLHQAAAMPRCRFLTDHKKEFPDQMKYLVGQRQAARLLYLEAVAATEEKDPAAAARAVVVGLGVADSLAEEPFVISQLVRLACDLIAVSSLEHTLNRLALPEEQLTILAGALARAEAPEAQWRGLVGDRCVEIPFFRPVDSFAALFPWAAGRRPWQRAGSRTLGCIYRWTGWGDLDLLAYLRYSERALRAAQQSLPERLATMESSDTGVPVYFVLTAVLLGRSHPLTVKEAKIVARLRCARAAVEIERRRLATGSLPADLGQGLPPDPFAGQPLRYKKLAKGYVVYSVGKDGKDDGGDAKQDIAFVVER
ncbi:hypothetical protein HQ590_07340 [bacterium]|nr:hypothetical protein [bacterium]